MKMTFTKYYSRLKPDAKKTLAAEAGTSIQYLSQISNGHRNAGFITIQNLMKADSNITYAMFEQAA